MTSKTNTWDQVFRHYEKINHVNGALSVLQWDQQTMMPPEGASQRGGQMSALQAYSHQLLTDPKFEESLHRLSSDGIDEKQRISSKRLLRAVTRAKKLPEDLVAALAEMEVSGYEAWKSAREANSFKHFQKTLENILTLKKQQAELLKEPGQTPYEALFEELEPDFPITTLNKLFEGLRKELPPLVKAIGHSCAKKKRDESLLRMPIEQQKKITQLVLELMHFDLSRGRVDETVHPFCSGSLNDIRLTTRYREDDWTNSLYSVLHEGGHGLYEQGLSASWGCHPLGAAASFGMHESQSRFWENIIGRSRSFCQMILPKLQKQLGLLNAVTPTTLHEIVNHVQPSFIRVDADEVTYNLHILVRYELELALFENKLSIADLPEAWNKKMNDYLGVKVPTDSLGVLQDVHWSGGAFGYFPTYSVGNLISAQLFEKMSQDFNIETVIESGNLLPVKEWLIQNIHAKGHQQTTLEIVKNVTKSELSHSPFIHYIQSKFATAL